MTQIESVLITGANAGLGRDCARQLALRGVDRIYLGCRNAGRAEEAKLALEQVTGVSAFEILLVDVSAPESVRSAVASLTDPVDAVVMNAGGIGPTPGEITGDGVTQIFATNVLGHAVLTDELIEADKLTKVAIYAGSEAARGVPQLRIKRPALATSSADEFTTIADGTFWGDKFDGMAAYAAVKYVAALWMSSIARHNHGIRFVTVSPGLTSGSNATSRTNASRDLSGAPELKSKQVRNRAMPPMHTVDKGAERYVHALTDEAYHSGSFYGSRASTVTGPLIEQNTIFADLANETFQDNANTAVHRFIRPSGI